MTRSLSRMARPLAAAFLALALGATSLSPAAAADTGSSPIALRSATAQPAVPGVNADVRLLHHTMLGVGGQPVPATTLLLTPKGAPPAGG
ncbi:hypothetical protein [Azospirillum endophyticum]